MLWYWFWGFLGGDNCSNIWFCLEKYNLKTNVDPKPSLIQVFELPFTHQILEYKSLITLPGDLEGKDLMLLYKNDSMCSLLVLYQKNCTRHWAEKIPGVLGLKSKKSQLFISIV